MDRETIIRETSIWIDWWIGQRKRKLEEQLSATMSVNPFLLPVIFDLHNLSSFTELSDLIVASHLMVGHSTGFGKLVDEKLLPNVFGTTKLDRAFRRTPPYNSSCFDEVDHLINRANGDVDILSLKSSRWTIQLTMAVQLNSAFKEIIDTCGNLINEIAVGVIYGAEADLTDKYDILRGINRGQNHSVYDLTDRVNVYAGRTFWAWLNDDILETQEWVLEGISESLRTNDALEECGVLLERFHERIASTYDSYVGEDGQVDWLRLLRAING